MEPKYDFFRILFFALVFAAAIALSLAITGCGWLVLEGSVLRPEEATATVLAQPTPTYIVSIGINDEVVLPGQGKVNYYGRKVR